MNAVRKAFVPGTRMGLTTRAALAALPMILSACGGDLSDAAEAGPARVSIVADFSANAVGDGARRAFDASDVLFVRIRSGTTVRHEEAIPVSPAGQDVRAPVELNVRRGGETLTLELELRSNGSSLFDGQAAVPVRRGENTPARVVLDPVVAGLEVSPSEVSMDAYGETRRISATPVFATGDPIDGLAVEWSTLDGQVATVDGTGTVTGVSDGDTRVVARLGERTASALVSIFAVVSHLTIDPPLAEIPLGQDVRFSALLADRNGNAILGRAVEWSSSDATLIEVRSDGTAQARGIGLANIRATSGEASAVADARGIPIAPGAGVRSATPLDPRTLEVVGGIRPNGLPTTAVVEWASDEEFTTGLGQSSSEAVPAGVDEVTVTIRPTGLLPGARYYGRILVENGVGEGQSEIFVFTMPIALPAGETGDPTSVTGGGATLPGRVDTGGGETRYRFQISRTSDFAEFWEVEGGVLPPGSSIQDVEVPVEGLAPGTNYCVRIVTTNEAGETFGAPVCFVTPGSPPPPPGPGVTTLAVGDITSTTARLNAAAQTATAGVLWFEWGTDAALGGTAATTPEQPVPAGTSPAVFADLAGLTPGTTYYVRAVLRAGGITRTGSTRSFTTPAGGPLAPSVGSVTVTEGPDGLTVSGTVTPNGAPTTTHFEWGTDPDPDGFSSTAPSEIGSGSTPVVVSTLLPALPPGTTIYVRAVAGNSEGVVAGPVASFTTGDGSVVGDPPTVGSTAVTGIGTTTATFTATVDPNGSPTEAWFEWSTDPAFTSPTGSARTDVGDGSTATPFVLDATGLAPATTHYVRVMAENAGGTSTGAVTTFTTGGVGELPPGVQTWAPLIVDSTSVKVGGTVNPHGLPTVAWFEWGTDPEFTTFSRTEDQSVGEGTTPTLVTHWLTGLTSGVTYYARIAASNAVGTSRGEIVSVTLP
jgi:hypothetical protein